MNNENHPTSPVVWPNHVRSAYDNLLELEQKFGKLCDAEDYSEAVALLPELAYMEHNVWVAWAECTQDINPGLMEEVKRKDPMKLPPKTRRHLEKHLYPHSMELFDNDMPCEPKKFADYVQDKDYKGLVDYMRKTPFKELEDEVLRAGFSTVGRYSGLSVFMGHVMCQVMTNTRPALSGMEGGK